MKHADKPREEKKDTESEYMFLLNVQCPSLAVHASAVRNLFDLTCLFSRSAPISLHSRTSRDDRSARSRTARCGSLSAAAFQTETARATLPRDVKCQTGCREDRSPVGVCVPRRRPPLAVPHIAEYLRGPNHAPLPKPSTATTEPQNRNKNQTPREKRIFCVYVVLGQDPSERPDGRNCSVMRRHVVRGVRASREKSQPGIGT